MLKHKIKLDESSDLPSILETIQNKIIKANIPSADTVYQVVETSINDFFNNGHKLSVMGSNFNAKKAVEGTGYSITIIAKFGKSAGILAQLKALFGR